MNFIDENHNPIFMEQLEKITEKEIYDRFNPSYNNNNYKFYEISEGENYEENNESVKDESIFDKIRENNESVKHESIFDKIREQPIEDINFYEKFDDSKILVSFFTTQGHITNLCLDKEVNVSDALTIYLQKIGRADLINNIEGKLCFLYNANQINFIDNRTLVELSNGQNRIKIIVNDVMNSIGA